MTLPLLTSCCPAWVKFCEERWPQYAPNISSCRSPQQMLGAVIRAWLTEREQIKDQKIVVVSIMPCTAKKAEILRPESRTGGVQDIDFSLTTEELVSMMAQAGLTFDDCPGEAADAPFSSGSGGGTLFGATGGVTEAVLRYLSPKLGFETSDWTAQSGVRGFENIKTAEIPWGERTLRAAVVSGLANADALLQRVAAGTEHYDLIEIMACPGGCIMGGGQPVDSYHIFQQRDGRSDGLYHTDHAVSVKNSQDNPHLQQILDQLIRGREHQLLHRNKHDNA